MGSWLACHCGNRIHTNIFVGAEVRLLVSEDKLDAVSATESARSVVSSLALTSSRAVCCSSCGRFYVLDSAANVLQVYRPEPVALPALTLVVLQCAELDRSRAFYEALGLDATREQHGKGPVHYSLVLGGTVLELYPVRDAPMSPLRLGCRLVISQEQIQRALDAGGVIASGADSLADTHLSLRDPDGHTLEIERLRSAGEAG